jgi:hypothetical protein
MDKRLRADDLAKYYFNVCNTALAQRQRDFPYSLIIPLLNHFFSGRDVNLCIVDDDDVPLEMVTTSFVNGQFTPIRPGLRTSDGRFTLKRSYLQRVADHADEYIRHPERLDWSWIIGGRF